MSFEVFQKQLLPPTGVELCIKANIIHSDQPNLILSKTNVLQIYSIRNEKIEKIETNVVDQQQMIDSIVSNIDSEEQPTQEESTMNNGNNSHSNSNVKKKIEYKPILELVIEKTLFGNIESMASIRFHDSDRDSLILSFRDAKIVILEYNQDTNDMEIKSMHYYEQEAYKNGRHHFKVPPMLKVDIQQRCAVMMLYDRHLVVLPFKQSTSILDEDDDTDFLNDDNDDTNKMLEEEDDELDQLFSQSKGSKQDKPATGDKEQATTAAKKSKLESYIIDLKALGIQNVKDFCFLYKYYEPTLLFLHEPSQTWTGRISVKKFTSHLTAVSLNTSQKTNPVIWSIDQFPYNCHSLVSVPDPLGGALVISANILFYINQSSRYGLAVNEYATKDTGDQFSFPLDLSLNLVFTLDRSNFVFLESDKFIGSLKGGELLIFHLISDGRSVQRMHVSKAGGSVLTSSVCVLSNNLIFLGSRLGDSLLLQYTEKSISDESLEHENFSNPYKKQKTSEVFDLFDDENETNEQDANGGAEEEEDEDDIFKEKKNQLKSYQLGICDQISNLGPIGDMVVGATYSPLTEEDSTSTNDDDRYLELVTCSGYGKNGSLSVLQYNVRPDLITAFDLPGVKRAWTLYYDSENSSSTMSKDITGKKRPLESSNTPAATTTTAPTPTATPAPSTTTDIDPTWHNYLFLSLNDNTLVFQTGDQLKEVVKLNTETLDVGNVFGKKRIVQVHSSGIKLFSGHSTITQEITTKSIKSSFILDPFVLLLFTDGTMNIMKGNSSVHQLMDFDFTYPDPIVSCSLFIDTISYFNSSNSDSLFEDNNNNSSNSNIYLNIISNKNSGTLEIYRLETKELVYKIHNLYNEYDYLGTNVNDTFRNTLDKNLMATIFNNNGSTGNGNGNGTNSNNNNNNNNNLNKYLNQINEFSIQFLSNSPYLIFINKLGDLLVYTGFKNKENQINFKKLNHGYITRSPPTTTTKEEKKNNYIEKKIISFLSSNNKKVIFIAGKKPLWLFCEKAYPRIFSMDNDGPIETFTGFHNVNCHHGFIYFTDKGQLRICQLSQLINYENHWPVRKIPVKSTTHKIAYHSKERCYVVVVSFPQVTTELDPNSKQPILTDEKFQIKLIDPSIDWNHFIDSFSLQDRETVLAMKIVSLKHTDADGVTKPRPFLVLGTAFTFGEDTQCKGRVLIFEIITHKNQFQTDAISEKRFNLLFEKEQKGPVTAVACANGLLLMTIGPKLIINNFSTGSLVGLAFYDAQIYIISISTIKNYILIGDMYKSVYFLQWKDGKQLVLLSKDYQSLNIFSTDFLINQKTLGLLVSDLDKNILLFSFDPQDPNSRSGQMMLCKADFHVGSNIQKFVRTPMKSSLGLYKTLESVKKEKEKQNGKENGGGKSSNEITAAGKNIENQQQIVFFGTLDGGLNVLRPLEIKPYQLLLELQSKMYYLPQYAGLNAKAYRAFKSFKQKYHFSPSTIHQLPKYILDGDLISKFLTLSVDDKLLISQSILSNPDEIIETLSNIYDSWNLF
ncbi:hypothetical protein CYY_004931 [Polysphondylium violaceum]|uniref:CPSF domain-containing protein n=1 Tax=Polysphondylium violaceum TaxID=133409 RepID=A0A8J4PUB6_9MYCE|nr:hypothetical protein CYY_004931 [Polysphondylium violaceum]